MGNQRFLFSLCCGDGHAGFIFPLTATQEQEQDTDTDTDTDTHTHTHTDTHEMGDRETKQGPITGVVVGCGQRGYGYSLYAADYPEKMKIVAAADPKQFRRDAMKSSHSLADDRLFTDWRQLAELGKIADFVIVATQDQDHKEPAIAFAKLGYHILLEKPMAGVWLCLMHTHAFTHSRTHTRIHALTHAHTHTHTYAHTYARTHSRTHTHTHARMPSCETLWRLPDVALVRCGSPSVFMCCVAGLAVTREDCEAITAACTETNVMLCVCHVLRYAPHNRAIKRLLEEGRIGRLVNLQHTEPIGFFHFAHSYVRGNWRREDKSTFALMAKSCHDIDLIRWWMDKPCKQVSSFGSLSEFHPARKPSDATERCLDCPRMVVCVCVCVLCVCLCVLCVEGVCLYVCVCV